MRLESKLWSEETAADSSLPFRAPDPLWTLVAPDAILVAAVQHCRRLNGKRLMCWVCTKPGPSQILCTREKKEGSESGLGMSRKESWESGWAQLIQLPAWIQMEDWAQAFKDFRASLWYPVFRTSRMNNDIMTAAHHEAAGNQQKSSQIIKNPYVTGI